MATHSPVQSNSQAGANQGVGASNPNTPPPARGDDALLKAMLMQILELNVLSTAAASESELSVALRQTMQATMNDRLEEIQKLMQIGAAAEGGTAWKNLWMWYTGGLSPGPTWTNLQHLFPDANLGELPTDLRGDFMDRLKDLLGATNGGSITEFRTEVGTLGTQLQQFGTYQTGAKNLADGLQNGAGSLTQSITQFLAQLATESGLMSDVVGQ